MTDITANEYRTAAKVCAAEEDWSRAKALRELADLIDANDARDAEREARHLASKLAHDAEITALAIIQMKGESGWWRGVECDKFADRTYESMTGDNQQAIRSGVSAVLAHLQSTSRLIPAGGMALTAEQVEDVRTVSWYTGAGLSRAPMAEIHRLRALFPATEPTDEVTQAEGFCSFCGWSRDACARGEGDCAPAEPAEEEAVLAARGEGWYEGYEVGLEYGPIAASGEEYDGPINPYDVPASSPVTPAPTETGPHIGGAWLTDGETKDAEMILRMVSINRHFSEWARNRCREISTALAPFIAAEEG